MVKQMILTPGSFTVCILRIIQSNRPRQTANGKREFVPRDQGFLFLVVIYTNSSSTPVLSIRIVLDCFLFSTYFQVEEFLNLNLTFAVVTLIFTRVFRIRTLKMSFHE